MSQKIFFWSLTAALAGFLFGFDTVVISGAEKTIQSLWQLSPATHGLAISMALWGTVLGSLVGGYPTDHLGRRKTLLLIGILYFASAVWSALATDINSFMIARFIGGLGVGISTVAAPLYISEISPANKRGWLAGLFQFNIVFGILVALVSNSLLANLGDNSWRWMLGVEAIPALVYSFLCFSLPVSPRWLIAKKGDYDKAKVILKQINPDLPDSEIDALANQVGQHRESTASGFWSSKLRRPITLAFLIAFFNQLSGINIILYFAPRLLSLAGFDDAFTAAISLGIVNLIFTFVGLWLIDRLGRKSLLLIGSVGYIVSLGVCSWAFLSCEEFKVISAAQQVEDSADSLQSLDTVDYREVSAEEKTSARDSFAAAKQSLTQLTSDLDGEAVVFATGATVESAVETAQAAKDEASKLLGGTSLLVLLCLLGFIASHAVGQGAVIWVFISEIFPNEHRASGQSFGCFTHWIFAAGLTVLFPIVIARVDAGYLFLFFCIMMCLQLVWVLVSVPETKGVPLEEIQTRLGVD